MKSIRIVLGFAGVAVAFVAVTAGAQNVEVYPNAVLLDNARDPNRAVVTQTREDGVTLDLTEQAKVTITPETLAVWDASFKLVPKGDGEGTVRVEAGGATVEIPITVRNVANDPAMSFRNDIEPALMRAGCNTGACHGAASGKNGFKLSLFGFDPSMDYTNLTRETLGRRLNAASPDESLMLLKPSGGVEHEGGTRIHKDDFLYTMLRRWIADGAQSDGDDLPALTGVEILPTSGVLEGEGAKQRLVVLAKYSDGTDRDVTSLAVLAPQDPTIVAIDDNGVATAGSRGEAYVMARYGTFAVVAQFIVLPAEATFQWPEDASPKNYVDELVYAKLKKLRVPPAERCSDEVFLRRATIDVLGMLPTVEESRAFLADNSPDKREKLLDRLLERQEFAELWAMKWAEVLRVKATANVLDPKGMFRYNDWLRQSILANKPLDQLIRELLTAEGGSFSSPAANFYLNESAPAQTAENVSQVFMGVRIQCAQCHNHPFERWTMDDYYSFAAFFAQIGRKNSTDPRERIVYNSGGGEVGHIKGGRAMPPKFLGGASPDTAGKDRRAVLADWLTSPENPWFAKNIANRVWEQFLGKGIIDPPDDVRVSNPPVNPELLDALGKKLVEYQYDLRKLVRDICLSNTYQLATHPRDPNARDTKNFAFAQTRRLGAEMMLDAVTQVTSTKVKFAQLPIGARAVQVADGNSGNYFLEVFGRPKRDSVCTCERRNEPTLAQTLHLINGNTLTQAMADGNGRLSERVQEGMAPETIVEDLYLAAYSRYPKADETAKLVEYAANASDKRQALEDIYWSVLNSKEFIFNH